MVTFKNIGILFIVVRTCKVDLFGMGGSGFEETDEAGRKYWAYGGDIR
jgi:hypothetical protein